jgi:hypothetical protein
MGWFGRGWARRSWTSPFFAWHQARTTASYPPEMIPTSARYYFEMEIFLEYGMRACEQKIWITLA